MSHDKPTPHLSRKVCYTILSLDYETMLDNMLENDEVRLAYYANGMFFLVFHAYGILEGSLVLPATDFPEENFLERPGNA